MNKSLIIYAVCLLGLVLLSGNITNGLTHDLKQAQFEREQKFYQDNWRCCEYPEPFTSEEWNDCYESNRPSWGLFESMESYGYRKYMTTQKHCEEYFGCVEVDCYSDGFPLGLSENASRFI